MAITRDRNGEKLERFDVCRNISQTGSRQFYYYIGALKMGGEKGSRVALFSDIEYGGVHVYQRFAQCVTAMEKVPELSGLTAEAQKRVKEELAKSS